MLIDKIIVSNFKSLENHTINLRNITVLAGGNSVGKSSTIQCILLIRSLIEKIFSKNLNNEAGTIDLPLNGPYMLSLGSTKEVISWETGKKFNIELLGGDESLMFSFEAENLEETNYFIKASFPSLEHCSSNIINNSFFYLNAERHGPRIRHWVNENPSNIHCGYQGQYTIEVLARLGEEPGAITKSKYLKDEQLSGLQTLSRYTQQWLNYIIPDTQLGNAEIFGNIRSASVKFNSFFSAPNVGFGVSYVLPIIVSALIATENSILVIENPEAHLHPKGQSRIGYFIGCMSLAGLQIIVETHSEHVINGIRLASVEKPEFNKSQLLINFYNRQDQYKALEICELNINENGDLSDFPFDFFDQAQQDLLEIMTLGRR